MDEASAPDIEGFLRPSPLWRRALSALADRMGVTDQALLAVAVTAVVAVVAVSALLASQRTPRRPVELDLPRATAADGTTGGGTADGTATSTVVVVHCAGAVAHPGVYRLAGGSRVADLIDAAGGPAPGADVDQLNLAALLQDGERVYVPRVGEVAVATAGGSGTVGGKVDLNSATVEQLDALPGVGPATAEAIVSWRKQHGRFRSVQQLLDVRGIGEAKLAQLRDLVRV